MSSAALEFIPSRFFPEDRPRLVYPAAPDETTILRFRHLLEQHDLGGEAKC
jgi:hypothetical protein